MVFDIIDCKVMATEKYEREFQQPGQLISFLKKTGVETLITGGCPGFYLRTLLTGNIQVIYGICGCPEEVLKLHLEGNLDRLSGNSPRECCNRERRRRRQTIPTSE